MLFQDKSVPKPRKSRHFFPFPIPRPNRPPEPSNRPMRDFGPNARTDPPSDICPFFVMPGTSPGMTAGRATRTVGPQSVSRSGARRRHRHRVDKSLPGRHSRPADADRKCRSLSTRPAGRHFRRQLPVGKCRTCARDAKGSAYAGFRRNLPPLPAGERGFASPLFSTFSPPACGRGRGRARDGKGAPASPPAPPFPDYGKYGAIRVPGQEENVLSDHIIFQTYDPWSIFLPFTSPPSTSRPAPSARRSR